MAAARRKGWLGPLLVAVLVAVPILEVWILIRVGRVIGGLPTIAILVLEALFGAWLMRREGSRAWHALKQTLASGRAPATELTDAALVLAGGLFLMLPGFVTDIFGFVFLLPWTRPLARRIVEAFASRQVARHGLDPDLLRARSDPGMTIDGEVVGEGNGSHAKSRPEDDDQDPPAITGQVI
ncbi:FxsA family protein [Luteococcus sp. OSA5]|uniref:FxsA family protein n=1 Tax=Luteococcus sp. OSA5 TaxID=3401630 RepID=UPI003B42A44A